MERDVNYIIDECRRFAERHDLYFDYDPAPLYPGNVTVRFVNPDNHENEIFRYNDLTHTPEEFINNTVAIITNKWLRKEKTETGERCLTGDAYRDQLVEQIKAAGQDLIDRAESFVAADLKMIGGFNICIDFPQDGPVEISTNMKTYSMNDKYYKDVVYYADNKPVLVKKGE